MQSMHLITRKVMLYPQPQNKSHPSYYLVIDQTLNDSQTVVVSYYPKVGDVVDISQPILVETIDN